VDIASFPPHPRAESFRLTHSGHNLEKLQPYIESEKLKAVIDPKSPYSFSDVIEAFKHQESRRANGKIVISPIDCAGFFLLIRNTFILSGFKYLLKPCVTAFRVVLHLLPYQGWKLGGYKIIMVSSVSGNANLDIQ